MKPPNELNMDTILTGETLSLNRKMIETQRGKRK